MVHLAFDSDTGDDDERRSCDVEDSERTIFVLTPRPFQYKIFSYFSIDKQFSCPKQGDKIINNVLE